MFDVPITQENVSEWTGTAIRIGDHEFFAGIPKALSPQGALSAVDFADDSHGWASYSTARVYWSPYTRTHWSPYTSTDLISTDDGGKTFRAITPPAAKRPEIPPKVYLLNGAILQFPPTPNLYAPAAGCPIMIKGTGFLHENTVRIGSRQVKVVSHDGENLQFLLPPEMAPGPYKLYIENNNGKSDDAQISVRAPETRVISNVNNGEPIHPGHEIVLSGSGLLFENQVWFGTKPVPAKLIMSGGPLLRVFVPDYIPPGSCDIHVSNANGDSNVVRVIVQ